MKREAKCTQRVFEREKCLMHSMHQQTFISREFWLQDPVHYVMAILFHVCISSEILALIFSLSLTIDEVQYILRQESERSDREKTLKTSRKRNSKSLSFRNLLPISITCRSEVLRVENSEIRIPLSLASLHVKNQSEGHANACPNQPKLDLCLFAVCVCYVLCVCVVIDACHGNREREEHICSQWEPECPSTCWSHFDSLLLLPDR